MDPSFVLALVNVIYFKDDWKNKFEESNSEFEFTQFNGEKVNHPFMFKESEIPYFKGKKASYVSLKYKNNTTAMVLALPKQT